MPDQYQDALRVVHESCHGDYGDDAYRLRLATIAQVHATLALVDQLTALAGVLQEPGGAR